MAKKLTAEEKIAKTLEYCEKAIDKAIHCQHTVRFIIELENTEGQIETEVCSGGSQYTGYYTSVGALPRVLKDAVKEAQLRSTFFDDLFTVRVWIKTFHSGGWVDAEPVNDYEINFERGVEV